MTWAGRYVKRDRLKQFNDKCSVIIIIEYKQHLLTECPAFEASIELYKQLSTLMIIYSIFVDFKSSLH